MFKKKDALEGLSSSYDSSALTFPQLNIEAIKQKFRLKDEAVKRGKMGLPSSEATHFDDVEQRITSFIDKHVEAATESYYDHIRSFEDRINRLNALGHNGSVENIAIRAEGDFAALVRRDKNSLYEAKLAVVEKEADLQKFKEEHGLDRAAHYPESRLFYYAIAIAFILFETVVNGLFFAKGHELGLLGGGFTALIPSLLNIAAGFFMAKYALRYIIHKNTLKKTLAIGLCFILPVAVVTLNLLVAHYRSAMMNIADFESVDAAVTAWQTFSAGPFALHDMESWLLFATGCFFSTLATIDFWKTDDPYPGFGEITRAYNECLQNYSERTDDSISHLVELRDHNHEALEEASNLLNAKVSEANMVIDSQNRWKLLYANHLTQLENAGRQLLSFYRSHNSGSRTTPAPAYFNDQWELNRVPLPETGVDFLRALSEFKEENAEIKGLYSSCVTRIGNAFSQSLHEYELIQQLQPEEMKKWRTESAVVDIKDALSVAA